MAIDTRECGWMGCGHEACADRCAGVPLASAALPATVDLAESLRRERDNLLIAYNSELDYSRRCTESAKRWVDIMSTEIVQLRETLARVEALADRWDEKNYPGMVGISTAIRAALRGDES